MAFKDFSQTPLDALTLARVTPQDRVARHFRLYELAGQPQTLDFARILWAKYPLDMLSQMPGRQPRVFDEHVALLAALESGAYLGLWLRGPMVVVEALAPGLLERLADSRPSPSIRYALYVQQHHAAIGAQWAREAGSTPLTCWLIEHHQDKQLSGTADERSLLARLQAADGAN